MALIAHAESAHSGAHAAPAPPRVVPSPPAPANAPAAAGAEVCQQCGARFPDVMALIAHAEAAHSSGDRQALVTPTQAPAPARVPPPAPANVPAAAGAELCQQCGARFPDVMALIAHAEAAHSSGTHQAPAPTTQAPSSQQQQRSGTTFSARGGGGNGAGSSGREVCPKCGMRFHDVTALVEHVQSKHERSSRNSQCRVC